MTPTGFEPLIVWLGASTSESASVGGFLFVALGSVAAGLTASTVRWLLLDSLHQWQGITAPALDYGKLRDNVHALCMLIATHYRYLQFYGNTMWHWSFFTDLRGSRRTGSATSGRTSRSSLSSCCSTRGHATRFAATTTVKPHDQVIRSRHNVGHSAQFAARHACPIICFRELHPIAPKESLTANCYRALRRVRLTPARVRAVKRAPLCADPLRKDSTP